MKKRQERNRAAVIGRRTGLRIGCSPWDSAHLGRPTVAQTFPIAASAVRGTGRHRLSQPGAEQGPVPWMGGRALMRPRIQQGAGVRAGSGRIERVLQLAGVPMRSPGGPRVPMRGWACEPLATLPGFVIWQDGEAGVDEGGNLATVSGSLLAKANGFKR